MARRKANNALPRFTSRKSVVAQFSEDHPVRRYWIEFHRVQHEVCGRDIEWPGRPRIEQEWFSQLLQKPFSFSSYAYCFISCDIHLDGWFLAEFENTPSPIEQYHIRQFQMKQTLLAECAQAAAADKNEPILTFVELARSVLELAIDATAHRLNLPRETLLKRWGVPAEVAAREWLEANYPQRRQHAQGLQGREPGRLLP
jgi:hypothetical protein